MRTTRIITLLITVTLCFTFPSEGLANKAALTPGEKVMISSDEKFFRHPLFGTGKKASPILITVKLTASKETFPSLKNREIISLNKPTELYLPSSIKEVWVEPKRYREEGLAAGISEHYLKTGPVFLVMLGLYALAKR